MRMKNVIILVLVAFAIVPMFANGQGDGSGGTMAAKPVIGTAVYKYDDTFMTGMRNAIQAIADKEGAVKIDMVDSQSTCDQSCRPKRGR